MCKFIQNKKGKVSVRTIILGLVLILILIGLVFLINHKQVDKKSDKPISDIRIPIQYTQPLVIKAMNNFLTIQSVNASDAKVIWEGKNKAKYIEAYPETDVVQIKYKNKLKEDIILKRPGHPKEFVYKLNTKDYDYKRDALNNLNFYIKGHVGEKLYRIFTIPAPFMKDAQGRVSNNRAVETILEADGTLILRPKAEWLSQATYPVVLDPTVEIHIINTQSYPTVGGPWEVRFNTLGRADLKVTGMSHDNYQTIFNNNIEFYELKCGEQIRQPVFDAISNSYIYKSWQCNQEASFTSTVLMAGKHHLQFNFGGQIDNAYNDATGFVDPTDNGTATNFSDPTNAFISDDNYAVGADTYVLDVDTFGFSFPTGSTIDGIEARIEWKLNSGTYNLSCQLLDASGSAIGDIKTTADNSNTTDIIDILGSATDMWGTTLGEADIEDVDFGVRCTAHKVAGILTAAAQVDNIDMQITYTAPANSAPTITSVIDSPDPVTVDKDVSFSVDWNDVDTGENIKVKICKTDSLTNQNCDGGYWATSTAFTTSDPESVSYTTQTADSGVHNYYAFVCDDEAACSSSTSGSFTVAPSITSVTDSPDPIGVGSQVTFTVDWNDDAGDMVKIHICKGSGIATSTQTCSDGSWADSDVFTNRDPENQVFYTTVAGDKGYTRDYWTFVCDDSNNCSDGTAGSFTVANQKPDGPDGLLVEGMEVGYANNITDITPEFKAKYKDSNDEGDVAVDYCIQVNTASDFSGTDMWVSDSASCYSGSAIGSNVSEGSYTPEFSYNGSALNMDGTVYYWRMWLWDGEERSATSTTGWFSMSNSSSGSGVRLQGGRLKGGVRLQ